MKSGLEGNPTHDVNIPLKQGWRSILASYQQPSSLL